MDDGSTLSAEELEAEGATALPAKEVLSLLDLNADLDIALDAAAPIDLGVAANANVAAPIDASVGANVLSFGSHATSLADQGALIDQGITGDATAHSIQDSGIDQGNDVIDSGAAVPPPPAPAAEAIGDPLSGNLLNVNVDLAADLDLAAPINGAVAANANVAAPIDAAVSANIGSIDSDAVAIADQDVMITQDITGDASAIADQVSRIEQ